MILKIYSKPISNNKKNLNIKGTNYIREIIIILTFFWFLIMPKKGLASSNKGYNYFLASYHYCPVDFFSKDYTWIENKFELGKENKLNYKYFFQVENQERFDDSDQLFSFGGLYFINKEIYISPKITFGNDINFLYKFKFEFEYSQLLVKNTFSHIKYSFADYPESDLHIFELGLSYYYLNHRFHFRMYIPNDSERDDTLSYLFEWHTSLWKNNYTLIGTSYGSRFVDIVSSYYPDYQTASSIYINFENQLLKNLKLGINITFLKEKPEFEMIKCGIYSVIEFL